MYFLQFVLLFLFCLLRLAPRLKRPSIFYTAGMCGGWICACLMFLFYISRHLYYQNVLSASGLSWWSPALYGIADSILKNTSIALFQFGLCVFLYCFVRYAFSGTWDPPRWFDRAFMILLGVEMVLCSPSLYYFLDHYDLASGVYLFMTRVGEGAFRLFHVACLAGVLAALLVGLIRTPHIRVLRLRRAYNLTVLTLLFISYEVLFGWAPKVLIRVTSVRGYFLYNVPDVNQQITFVNSFIYISLALLLVIAYMRYRYSRQNEANSAIVVNIRQRAKTAEMGMRVFTHSIKNELQGILAETEFLEDRFAQDPESMYSLKLIRESCNRAFENIQSGNSVLKRQQFQMRKMPAVEPVRQVIKLFQEQHTDLAVELQDLSNGAESYLDAAAIQETLKNLLNNAADAIADSDNRGCGAITLRLETRMRWLSIQVQDNGKGMSEEECARVFEPFYTTKSSTTNWGIGLSYCYNVIYYHGGQMQVKSAPGVGTTFELFLPCA